MRDSSVKNQTGRPRIRGGGCMSSGAIPPLLGFGRIATHVLAAASLALGSPPALAAQPPSGGLELKTAAFPPGGAIPKQFTCDGPDMSPALSWTEPPPRTQSFVLIVDDPDAPAGTWVHWVVYNLPASARQIPEHALSGDAVQGAGLPGVNDFHRAGYGGPCPPPGKPHRYFFRLYALDIELAVKPKASRKDVDQAMRGHVLAHAELMGTYGR